MTQNLTEHEHESIHFTHTTDSQWDTQGTLHVYDDTENGRFAWLEKIWIPALTGFSAAAIAWAGFTLSWSQENNANNQQIIDNAKTEIQGYVDRATQASRTRQEVLTEYSTRISDLRLEKLNDPNLRNVLRGETLIALRRLDDNNEIRKYMSRTAELIKVIRSNTPQGKDITSEDQDITSEDQDKAENDLESLKGFNDAGELKGFLVRFLRESRLLNKNNPIVNLWGANITRVNLNYSPLPDIYLKGAWLTWGTFQNADLRGADLSYTNLREADLRGADLRGALLTDAKLSRACYDENTLIDSKHKVNMRDTTGQPIDFLCENLQ